MRMTVPGTGGCLNSIGMIIDTNYKRVIVAGEERGASGWGHYGDPCCFRGGQVDLNCYIKSFLQKQGAVTQTGSRHGLCCDDSIRRDPVQFCFGATGEYYKWLDSGRRGGSGCCSCCLYGGGSWWYVNSNRYSSDGWGFGLTFTKSILRQWQLGDSSNASKFALNSSYYLTDGNEEFLRHEGNNIEHVHDGDLWVQRQIMK